MFVQNFILISFLGREYLIIWTLFIYLLSKKRWREYYIHLSGTHIIFWFVLLFLGGIQQMGLYCL